MPTLTVDHNLVIFFRKPKSKKKRIVKKWKTRSRNYKPDTNIYRAGNRIICHPINVESVRNAMCVSTTVT